MKRNTLLSFITLFAMSICFFSSAVLAGEGEAGDTDPWESDVVIDTAEVYIDAYASNQKPETFTWSTFSLSYKFTTWLYYEFSMFQQKKQVEATTKEYNNEFSR